MRLKNIFTIPAGQKVTEKSLYRVLVSSICSILLCMTCLVSTSWAWFTVSIENEDNIIQIAKINTHVTVTQGNAVVAPAEDGSYVLPAGEYEVSVGLVPPERTSDSANLLNGSQPPVYVVMTISYKDSMEYRLFTFSDRSGKQSHQLAVSDGQAAVSFFVSWVKPAFGMPDGSVPATVGEIPVEPSIPSAADPAETD